MFCIRLLSVSQMGEYESLTGMEKYISSLRAERISHFRTSQDKILCLFAELVIRYDIIRTLSLRNDEISFYYNRFGKPLFLYNGIPFCFSVSHCDEIIAYVHHTNACGIDVEKLQCGMKDVSDRYFTEDESLYINQNSYSDRRFTEIWTRKEAYLKMKGTGLNVPLDSFSVLDETLSDRIITFREGAYFVSLCSENTLSERIEIIRMNPDEIIDFFSNSL